MAKQSKAGRFGIDFACVEVFEQWHQRSGVEAVVRPAQGRSQAA